jgi:hypothetical protein
MLEVITPLAVVNHHDVQQFEVEDVNSDDDDDVDEEAEDSLNEKNDENDLQLRLQLDYAKVFRFTFHLISFFDDS